MSQRQRHSGTGWWVAGAVCAVLAAIGTIGGLKHYRTRSAIAVIQANGYDVSFETVDPFSLKNLVGIGDWFLPVYGVWQTYDSLNTSRRGMMRILERLPDLPEMRHVALPSEQIVDGDLVVLSRLPRLEGICLAYTSVTGTGFKHLRKLKDLKGLDLSDVASLTDEGFHELGQLAQLTDLKLDGAKITDEQLVHLTPLKNLRRLSLSNTGVSEFAIEKLREAIPDLEVTDD